MNAGQKSVRRIAGRTGNASRDTICLSCRHRLSHQSRRHAASAAAVAEQPEPTQTEPPVPPVTQTGPQKAYRLLASTVLSRPPLLTRELTPFEKAFYLYQKRLNERLALPFTRYFYFKKNTPADVEWKRKQVVRKTAARDVGVYSGYGDEAWNDEVLVGDQTSEPSSQIEALIRDAEGKDIVNAKPVGDGTGGQEIMGEPAEGEGTAKEIGKKTAIEKPMPRITEADRKGDVRSLNRKLDRCLYLLVQNKDGRWRFPEDRVYGRENLHQAAERILHQSGGVNMNTWIVGNHPVGHFIGAPFKTPILAKVKANPLVSTSHDFEQEEYGEKVFFMKGRIMAGQADLSKNEYGDKDFQWLSKEEVEEKVGRNYWKAYTPLNFLRQLATAHCQSPLALLEPVQKKQRIAAEDSTTGYGEAEIVSQRGEPQYFAIKTSAPSTGTTRLPANEMKIVDDDVLAVATQAIAHVNSSTSIPMPAQILAILEELDPNSVGCVLRYGKGTDPDKFDIRKLEAKMKTILSPALFASWKREFLAKPPSNSVFEMQLDHRAVITTRLNNIDSAFDESYKNECKVDKYDFSAFLGHVQVPIKNEFGSVVRWETMQGYNKVSEDDQMDLVKQWKRKLNKDLMQLFDRSDYYLIITQDGEHKVFHPRVKEEVDINEQDGHSPEEVQADAVAEADAMAAFEESVSLICASTAKLRMECTCPVLSEAQKNHLHDLDRSFAEIEGTEGPDDVDHFNPVCKCRDKTDLEYCEYLEESFRIEDATEDDEGIADMF